MAQKAQSIVSLDPIDRKKQKGPFARFLITRYSGGKSVQKTYKFGHYMFCGPQRSGKTSSALWYAEKLGKYHRKRRLKYKGEDGKMHRFDEPPKIGLWSNFGVGKSVNKQSLFKLIDEFDPYGNEVRIILIDEIHGYFPRGAVNKETQHIINDLLVVFSQVAKRNTYILSTAQVYGRLDKALREQCLYMVNCRVSTTGRLINDFILGDDIIADELGRWAGDPQFIYKHGLSRLEYDTKKLVRE